jgi:transcriptional regulator EpsA
MVFFSALSDEHMERYFRIIREGIAVREHSDVLKWLQGELQYYLPHEIMLAAWGDFGSIHFRHDLVSALPGVRTQHIKRENLSALLRALFNCWVELGKKPYILNVGPSGFAFEDARPLSESGKALHGMQSMLVHGITDERGAQDCLYILFSSRASLDNVMLAAMETLMPYLDTAMRRVTPLADPAPSADLGESQETTVDHGLSNREIEILHWVRMGKTNAEIASILGISIYTVKNHLRHIFKKLDVYNRTQAISKIRSTSTTPRPRGGYPASADR